MFERDVRLGLMDSLLAPAQAPLKDLVQLHADALELDAPFYGHLATWYQKNGRVRSFREIFVAGLGTSPMPEHREAAWVLLQQLAPHQVAGAIRVAKQHFGRCPRSLRSAAVHYLRQREANPHAFDRAALRQARALKELYAGLHVAPGARAQAVLFARRPPEGSLAWKVKQLARCPKPAEQALKILELSLPFPVAVGVVRQVTPAVLAALVEVMTPAEVMNHMKMLQGRGALEHTEIRARVEAKLAEARRDRRVSDYKGLVAAEVVADEQLRKQLQAVTQQRLVAQGQILKSTAILVDKSSSLQEAIEVGKRVAALAAGLMKPEVPLHVLVFDTVARALVGGGTSVAEWEHAFRGVTANGATSIGAPVAWLRAHRVVVEQLVVVTDEEENTAPYFCDQWELYAREIGVRPEVTLLKVGAASSHLERQLRQRQVAFDTYQFTGDYYSLPNLIPMLTRPGRLELLMEILGTPLPVKPDLAPAQQAC
jgi:hypothetical protein